MNPVNVATKTGSTMVIEGVPFEHRYANVNGTRLHYLIAGDRQKPVLLIHGFPGSWRGWEPLIGKLVQAGYTPIAVDFRGAGESDITEDGYDKKNMARDLHELVASLNLKSVHVVGHDMGLVIAYAYAASYPDETQRVVLMDGFLPGIAGWETAYNGNPDAGIASKWHFRFFGRTALQMIQGNEQTYLDMFFDDFVFKGNAKVGNENRAALLADYTRPGRMEAAFKLYAAWVQHDVADNQAFSKRKLTTPILTIGGDHSRGKTLSEQVAHVTTQASSLVLANTGHWVLEEQTEATSQAILDFLRD